REIGVMRAIGASNGAIQRIVIVEGVIIGLLSWMMGGMLAFPVGLGLSNAVGAILFQTALPYSFSATGVFSWLAIVAVLAMVASSLPAWNASRLTVREVLAYE
ncbi:MAG: FtsX-like permease family protein, partial [Caldilineaceae bacterium]|nr:FtsX-like permease family protein [Caldilineaceae bacterium]